MDNRKPTKPIYQDLFNLISKEHGINLTEAEMNDIINVVRKIKDLHECSNCGEMVVKISTGEICPACYC